MWRPVFQFVQNIRQRRRELCSAAWRGIPSSIFAPHRILDLGSKRCSDGKCCGRWSPDGNMFVFGGPEDQIFALDEKHGLFRPSAEEPLQLTSRPVHWGAPVFARDGKKVLAAGSINAGRLEPRRHTSDAFALTRVN